MNINKNSWHYKVVKLFSNGYENCVPQNLCAYTRTLLIGIAVYILIALGSLSVSLIALVPLFITAPVPMAVSSCIFWLIGGGGLLTIVQEDKPFKDKYPWLYKNLFTFSSKEVKNKEPNILVEYIKAKHSKICPTLSFKDE